MLFLFLAAAIWALGWAFGAPLRLRLGLVGGLYIGVIVIGLAQMGSLGMMMRDEAGPLLVFGGLLAIVLGYRKGLQWVRARAVLKQQIAAAPQTGTFSEAELNRYARHIVLREVGGPGQKALKQAKVLVVGAGGLGSPALMYLGAAGVGTLGVVDDDVVDGSNLHRQVIHTDATIGMPKVFSAKAMLEAQNPFVEVRPYHRRLSFDIVAELIADYDLVLDGTDNFDTRYLVNAACVAAGVPLISGALTQWEGQLSVFDPARGAPCYQCIFPEAPAPELAPACAEAGVIGPLPGVIGTMMALEAVKVVCDAGAPLRGEMLIYDGLWGETRKIRVAPRADCPACQAVRSTDPAK